MARKLALLLLLGAAACGSKGSDAAPGDAGAAVAITPKGQVIQAAENEGSSSASPAEKAAPAASAASPIVEIPSGKLMSGSIPGDKGRDPMLEPVEVEVELGGYSIDRYLYPNDPAKPPMVGVSRTKAAEICQSAGARLCTELEWERACKGPDQSSYAGSAKWDSSCAKSPAKCASGFGVLGLGAGLREWTASDVVPIDNALTKGAAVRGARADAAGADHRCAHRSAVDPGASGEDLGFRCCRGAPNAAAVASPKWEVAYRKAELSPAQAAAMFATVPELKELAGEITYFKEPDDVHQVMSRGDAGVVPNTTFTTMPLLWNPVPGEEILVVAGRAKKDSFIVAFYRLPGDRYRIASSFILKDEKGPIALSYNVNVRRKLSWGTCYDCRGESGLITHREDNRVVITQK